MGKTTASETTGWSFRSRRTSEPVPCFWLGAKLRCRASSKGRCHDLKAGLASGGPHAGRVRVAGGKTDRDIAVRSEEHTSELQSQSNLVCRLLLEKKKNKKIHYVNECLM